jgi:hypothetical protein
LYDNPSDNPSAFGAVIINAADVISDWAQCPVDVVNLPGVSDEDRAKIWYKDVPYRATQLLQNGIRLTPSRYPAKDATTSPAHPSSDGGPGWCFPTTVGDDTNFFDTGLNGLLFASDE